MNERARLESGLPHSPGRIPLLLLICGVVALGGARGAYGQASALLSPGPLAKPHAHLEGLSNCARCHEPGRQVTASRCLSCHRPIAERIAARRGVHRAVKDDCVGCHSEHNGRDAELRPFDVGRFDHAAETGFPLEGRHAPLAANCARCHTGRSFLQARPACVSCHADPHKPTLGSSCANCHSVQQAFAEARRGFDHAKTRFPLTGAHRAVDCARCHANKVFSGLRFASCGDCHKTPHRQALAAQCTACHATDTWRTQKMDHARTAFPLRGRHEAVPCASCHKGSPVQVRLEFGRCSACHADIHRGQFKEDCAACHSETGFRSVPFDHAARTTFPLTGRHAGLPCARCHKGAVAARQTPAVPVQGRRTRTSPPGAAARLSEPITFAGASRACSSCHADPHRGETAADCATCHTTSDFRVSAYQHEARLAPLFAGRHAAMACGDCHGRLAPKPFSRSSTGPSSHRPPEAPRLAASSSPGAANAAAPVSQWRFKNIGTACSACHADPHEGQLRATCETCHGPEETSFRASRFSHDKTGFPLAGRHRTVPCASCHRPPGAPAPRVAGASLSPAPPQALSPLAFGNVGKDCASCHADAHLGQLGTACQRCHGEESFRLASFKHSDRTPAKFFEGTHGTLACRACHRREQARFPAGTGLATRYVGMGTNCATCHAENDVHRGALGQACETCHEVSAWKSASRAFHKAGIFPLEGRHLGVPCASCHTGGVTKGTPTACYDCHWIRRQDDRYQTRLGVQCEQCHRPTGWVPAQWNHGANTGFQLNLAHQVLRCDNCHRDGQFTAAGRDCFGCHQADYARAATPNHAAAGFPTSCEICHTAAQTSWRQATFDHARSFQLVGVHAALPCASCHRANVFAGTPRECIGCHRDDYQRTANPNHAAAGFPTACESCHRPTDAAWRGVSFNHAAFFPLVGVHATQSCAACHRNSVYKGTARDCLACHQDDYQRTANPPHAAAGFGTACEACHSAAASTWSATFDHNRVFPLVGAHQRQACSTCHRNGVYRGTPTDCVGCHLADYQRTSNPNHASAGFPTSCQSCHRADGTWRGATFNHAWFPITSGRHAVPCASCHTTPNNYAVFSCTNCHTRGQTDPRHQGVSGYRYDSAACYACHPTGRGD